MFSRCASRVGSLPPRARLSEEEDEEEDRMVRSKLLCHEMLWKFVPFLKFYSTMLFLFACRKARLSRE